MTMIDKLRVLTTELDYKDAPNGTIVRDKTGIAWQKAANRWWRAGSVTDMRTEDDMACMGACQVLSWGWPE